MGKPVKIETGFGTHVTPVFITAFIEPDPGSIVFDIVNSISAHIELRIGEPHLAGKTRLVHISVEEAERIAEALQDAAREVNDAADEHRLRVNEKSKPTHK
jgi:hypothetical protein